jgi:hypothetical protein
MPKLWRNMQLKSPLARVQGMYRNSEGNTAAKPTNCMYVAKYRELLKSLNHVSMFSSLASYISSSYRALILGRFYRHFPLKQACCYSLVTCAITGRNYTQDRACAQFFTVNTALYRLYLHLTFQNRNICAVFFYHTGLEAYVNAVRKGEYLDFMGGGNME